MENKDMELDILKRTVQKQGGRIADLIVDLDVAHSQIEYLTEQIKKVDEKEETKAE